MFDFRSLTCFNCNSVMLNLPKLEVEKLNGLRYRCECCDHLNMLKESRFHKDEDRN